MTDRPLRVGFLRYVVALGIAGVAWIATLSSYAYAASAGDDPLPPPYNTVLMVTLATATLILVAGFVASLVLSQQRRILRRLDAVYNGLVAQGVTITEAVTGEIPRIPRQPGLDAEVLDIGRRISRRLTNHAPTMRQDD